MNATASTWCGASPARDVHGAGQSVTYSLLVLIPVEGLSLSAFSMGALAELGVRPPCAVETTSLRQGHKIAGAAQRRADCRRGAATRDNGPS